MMKIKAHSAEKIKPQPVRIKECLTCPRPTNTKSHERDYIRPQAVKIRLLMQDEENKKAKKSSTKKKILPERLGLLLNKKSSTKEKDNGLCTYTKSKSPSSCANRNLDFNTMSVSTVNTKTDNIGLLNKSTNTEQTSTEVCKPKMRISMLAVPNSIKNKHLQGCVKEARKDLKLDVVKENVPSERKSAVPIYSSKSIGRRLGQSIVGHNKNDITESQCKVTSSKCESVQNAITNQTSASSCKIPSAKLLEKDTCSLDENYFKYLGPETVKEDECIKRLCNNLQSTEIIVAENGLNTEHTSSEMLCVDRNEFMHLKCELENFISTTEQNLSKLKSTLRKLLSIPQQSISRSDISKERETNITLDKENKVESCELKEPTEENSKFTDSCSDDLENQVDIETVKKLPSLQNTPVTGKYRQKCPLKEYMSLKSSMSFLRTPDGKHIDHRINIDESTIENKSYISNKVLAELQNLYSDSPF
ncbi:uncharacterized protein LOC143210524 [Lasioglossum baleicum]|uniref:uncharacterized protein LOC143210524 n=1 Tax=Lasioglossum baleicum TaxID=434251 RepID=UPI003FCD9679